MGKPVHEDQSPSPRLKIIILAHGGPRGATDTLTTVRPRWAKPTCEIFLSQTIINAPQK